MRPVDFIGSVQHAGNDQVVSHVEGTIFAFADAVTGTAGWQGNLLKWQDEDALLAAHRAGARLLLVCNDGRRGEITLDPDVADWGTGMRFRGIGVLSDATIPPAWRSLDRVRAEDGAPDK